LFGSNKDTVGKSELVLSITPRIVRNLPYQSPSDMEFPTGTETSMHIQAPDRGTPSTVNNNVMATPVASTVNVVVEKN
jgi:general secretion pathway protein D